MTHPVIVVWAKEVRDNLRDRRSLLTALIYPLLGPLLFGVLLHVLGGVLGGVTGGAVKVALPVVGAAHAPDLVAWLKTRQVRILPAPADPDRAVRGGEAQLVLILPEGFQETIASGGAARALIYSDASRLQGEMLVGELADLLRDWGRTIAARRLEGRGLDPALLEPVLVDNVVVVKRRNVLDLFLHLVPPFVMFTVFIGGVYLAIDTTSGERERGSLEPLMANPVPRWQIMLGKFLAAYVFTAVALAVQLGAFALVFGTVGHGLLSRDAAFGPGTVAALLALCVPLMALTVAVQIIIAALTRSFKEAQTWLGLLPLAPAIPGLALVFAPVRPALWMAVLPVFSQTVAMGQVVRGDAVPLLHVLVSALATLAAAALLLWWAARLFEREEMIFGA